MIGCRARSRRALVQDPFVLLVLLLGAAAPGLALDADLSRPGADTVPTPVHVGLYLADFSEVSGSEQTFLADIIVRAEWQDPRLAGRWAGLHGAALEEVWNPRLQLVNQRGVTAALPQRVEVDTSGHVSYRQRWSGRFATRLDLRDFPLDRQRFHIQVVSLGYTPAEVDLIVDGGELRSGQAADFAIPDWEVGPARMERADLDIVGARPLAGAALRWEARRHFRYYAVDVILPLILVVIMGWTALWVDSTIVNPRVSVTATTMLTLIAYRFSLGRSVPRLNYLTRFDYFMLGSTILTFLVLVIVAADAYLVHRAKTPVARRIDRWARLVLPLAFAVMLLLVWRS